MKDLRIKNTDDTESSPDFLKFSFCEWKKSDSQKFRILSDRKDFTEQEKLKYVFHSRERFVSFSAFNSWKEFEIKRFELKSERLILVSFQHFRHVLGNKE